MSGLTGKVPKHPAEYSPEIIAELARRLRPGELIVDPFAGRGLRLGALCDRLGLTVILSDLEDYPERDPRVVIGADATKPASYPAPPFTTVCSPCYFDNRISTDYVNGPTPSTKRGGRHAYGNSLGRALHPDNLARLCRPTRGLEHDERHGQAVACWDHRALVNVDGPLEVRWCTILTAAGFTIVDVVAVRTRRLGGVANRDKRAKHEVVIEAER